MDATFTEQLRAAIRDSELSRNAICRAVGLDKAVMSRFMAGRSGLSLHNVDALCGLLGLELVKRAKRKEVRK